MSIKPEDEKTVSRRELIGRSAGVALTFLAGGAGSLHAEEITHDDSQTAQKKAPTKPTQGADTKGQTPAGVYVAPVKRMRRPWESRLSDWAIKAVPF